MKLGTHVVIEGRRFEVSSIRPNGGLSLRPIKPGTLPRGSTFEDGEVVDIVYDGVRYAGEIVSLAPVRAVVTSESWCKGLVVSGTRVRKARKG